MRIDITEDMNIVNANLPIIEPIQLTLEYPGQIFNICYVNNFYPGDIVVVSWNGVQYQCTVKGPNSMYAFIGNNSLYGGKECGEIKNTGEPFFIARAYPHTFIIAKELKKIELSINKLFLDDETTEQFDDNLPKDFPRFNFIGESKSKSDFLITPYTANFDTGYIFILDYQGKLKWYKHLNSFGYNFKQFYNSKGEIRYSYMVTEEPLNGQYDLCHGVIMNDKMEVIKDNIKMLACGTTQDNCPLECHTFTFFDDDHYITSAVNTVKVDNIPDLEGSHYVLNNIIQEQQDGVVIWHFETIDYPELYSASAWNNKFIEGTTDFNAVDYAHINAISRDKDGNILLSFRNIGLVKVNYKTKKIMWIIGRARNDIQGLEYNNIPFLQHDVRYLDDNSFTVFDNYGCDEDYTRMCRYWINEQNKSLDRVEIFNSNYPRSLALGYGELIDNNIYDITYGYCSNSPALEEYDFTNGITNLTLTFNKDYPLYNISRAIKNFEE